MKFSDNLSSILDDLNKVSSKRIYFEVIAIALISWSSFFMLFTSINFNVKIFFYLISMFSFYRGLSLNHEVSHLDRVMPKFKHVFNFLFGYWHRYPAYTIKTHFYHHSVKTFGSEGDPEYERWTDRKKIFLFRPIVLSFLFPFVLTFRFGIFPLVYPFLKRELLISIHKKFSSFVMNYKFMRPFREDDFRQMLMQDFSTAICFLIIVSTTMYFHVAKLYFTLWVSQVVLMSLMNTYRTLVAHRYQVHKITGHYSNKEMQVIDSVVIEGTIFNELWAPLGLRFHSTHHMLPSIPYYNLNKAHQRLKSVLPGDHYYFKTIEPNFLRAFKKLINSCQ